jgi:hypothetical protein
MRMLLNHILSVGRKLLSVWPRVIAVSSLSYLLRSHNLNCCVFGALVPVYMLAVVHLLWLWPLITVHHIIYIDHWRGQLTCM